MVLTNIGFIATGKDGNVLVFEERACGLFAMDARSPESSDSACMDVESGARNSIAGGQSPEEQKSPTGLNSDGDLKDDFQGYSCSMDSTLAKHSNANNFTAADSRRARAVRDLQHILGHPSDRTLSEFLDRNKLLNCPYTSRDVRNADSLLGPCQLSLKGKATGTQGRSGNREVIEVPRTILDRYGKIGLYADIMFIGGLAFLVTISSDIKCYSVAPVYGPGHRSGKNSLN